MAIFYTHFSMNKRRRKSTRSRSRRRNVRARTVRSRSRSRSRATVVTTRPTKTAATNIYDMLQGPRSIFPETIRTTLRWAERVQIQHFFGAGFFAVFNVTSLYQPFTFHPTHQPRYFDQVCGLGLYSRFQVNRVRYTLEFPEVYNQPQWIVAQFSNVPTPSGTSAPDIAVMTELPYSQMSYSAAGSRPDPMSGTFLPHKFFGITKAAYDANLTYSGTYLANPVQMAFLTISTADIQESGTDVAPTNFYINFEFDATFTNRQQVASS